MKKIKLLYLLPLAAMVLSGCENPFKKKQNTEPEQQQSGDQSGGDQGGGGGQQQSVALVDFENKADTNSKRYSESINLDKRVIRYTC